MRLKELLLGPVLVEQLFYNLSLELDHRKIFQNDPHWTLNCTYEASNTCKHCNYLPVLDECSFLVTVKAHVNLHVAVFRGQCAVLIALLFYKVGGLTQLHVFKLLEVVVSLDLAVTKEHVC